MTRTILAAVLVGLSSLGLLAGTATAAFNANGGRASFHAVGPAGLAIEGQGGDVQVHEKDGHLAVTVGLNSLKTGIDLRDRHMKEKYLETGKFATATLTVDTAKLRRPSGEKVSADVDGTLSLHGVTKQVRVHYVASGDPKNVQIDGSVHLKMTDYGIVVPSYLGVTVKPDVDIKVSFHAVDS
jgi:polyisoprenoid-binding protein YceI